MHTLHAHTHTGTAALLLLNTQGQALEDNERNADLKPALQLCVISMGYFCGKTRVVLVAVSYDIFCSMLWDKLGRVMTYCNVYCTSAALLDSWPTEHKFDCNLLLITILDYSA